MSYKDRKQTTVVEETRPSYEAKLEELTLPKADIYKRLKKLSSFKKIKKTYKLEQQKSQFLVDLGELFKHLDVKDHQYDVELLLELINATEQYFIYGDKEDRTKSKREVIEIIMLKFFDNKVEVLDKFINVISNRVKKSNVLRRSYRRVYNFFF